MKLYQVLQRQLILMILIVTGLIMSKGRKKQFFQEGIEGDVTAV